VSEPLRVEVRRGGIVEAVHRVHVVAGEDVFGDGGLVCFLRSSLKPLQAVPLVEAYDDLGDDEIAIACASHQAEPAQLEAVRKLLARAGATADDLENGMEEGRPEGKLGHNCSGKHAGMLAACRANGWPLEGYRLPGHPLQQRIRELVGDRPYAIDGCGVPTYAFSLSEMATILTRVPQRIREAMHARPELVGGLGADDTDLMQARPELIAKRGAEGLFCADGLAVKVEDGSSRAIRPVLGMLFAIADFVHVPVANSRGEDVGEITVAG
jgi:L-asparaginase II